MNKSHGKVSEHTFRGMTGAYKPFGKMLSVFAQNWHVRERLARSKRKKRIKLFACYVVGVNGQDTILHGGLMLCPECYSEFFTRHLHTRAYNYNCENGHKNNQIHLLVTKIERLKKWKRPSMLPCN